MATQNPTKGEPNTENEARGLREESSEGKTGPKKGPKGTMETKQGEQGINTIIE